MHPIDHLRKLAKHLSTPGPDAMWIQIDQLGGNFVDFIKRDGQWYYIYHKDNHIVEAKKIGWAEIENILRYHPIDSIDAVDTSFETDDHSTYFGIGKKDTGVSIAEVLNGIDQGFQDWVDEVDEEGSEEPEKEYYTPSDYAERMEERRQMGLSDF